MSARIIVTDEVRDKALAICRQEYSRVYQLTHDPQVARLVDAAVESALDAVAPLIAERVWDEALAASAKWSQDQRYYVEDEVHNPYRIEDER